LTARSIENSRILAMIGKTISPDELTLNPSLKKRGTYVPLPFRREGDRG